MATPSMMSRIRAVAALHMGFSLMSGAFSFYYVKVFLNLYKIEESWFQVSQILFAVWNAINDPLFAYFQDSTNFKFSRTRRESVLYAAPLFALSFLVPWFPWTSPETTRPWVTGVHLITALCFWDTMFTYVGLAACCLFTEVSSDSKVRLTMVRYTEFGGLLGSSSVFILQYLSDGLEYFVVFQTACVVLAVVACLLMRYAGHNGFTELELKNKALQESGQHVEEKRQEYSYIALVKQILNCRDFLAFVITNFFQEFHRTYVYNFFTIICDQLIPISAISSLTRSLFYGGTSILSKICTITISAPLAGRYGYFNVIRFSFMWKIAAGIAFYTIGPVHHWLLMLYLIADMCFANSTFSLYNMPLSDIADKDCVRYSRRHPVTSMVYGTNALVVKPAISIAPMLVVAILNRYGYAHLKDDTLSAANVAQLNHVMFAIISLFPVLLGSIQFCVWSFYTMRGTKTRDVTLTVGTLGDNL